MGATTLLSERVSPALKVYYDSIHLKTERRLQFIDLTNHLIELVRKSRVLNGLANVQTQHTTTALMVGEHEPLLLEDMKKVLEKLAPLDAVYQHDNFDIRSVNLCAAEEKNGHSHCKAMFLRTSETLKIIEGTVQLGQWQRVLFIELDRGKGRTVSVMVIGQEA